MKKFLKIFAIVLGVLFVILLLSPMLFERQLKDLVQKTINDNLNAQVSFADIDLSLFRNFPDATLEIEELLVINNEPFEGDTLAASEKVVLQMSVRELFKGSGDPMKIDALKINNTLLRLEIDSLGNANYDVAIKSDAPATESSSGNFQFDVEHYEINNSTIKYVDQKSKLNLLVEDLSHKGTGDFSAATSTLSTLSTALVSLMMDDVNYLDKNKVKLEADFKMDLEKMRFTFLENEALINQLPLTFNGYVQVNEDNNEVDISFKTPTSSFKNFLAVMPEAYSKNIEDVKTSGDFVVDGFLRGIIDETSIPKMKISIASNNASFKYPDLPKSVQDISIAAEVINDTGVAEDTYVDINKLNFRIDEDAFRANGNIRNLTGNMLVNMALDGTINLANLEKAYPLELEQDLNGIVTANVTTSFDMDSVEKEQYQNVKSKGTATVRNFSYASPEIPNEVKLATAKLQFNTSSIALENLVATTGKTDLVVDGTIQNLMGYLFTDQKLKGDFRARSKTFSVNDFMVKKTVTEEGQTAAATKTTPVEDDAIRIPSFLDAQLDFKADQVLYDNLVLKNTSGSLRIENETATLNNITASILGGNILLNGNVSTKEQVPNFNMKLDLTAIDIAAAFADMALLRNLAPIAQALQGQLTTNIDLRGDLNKDLTPQLQTLAGNALAEVLGAKVNPEQAPLLNQLNSRLNFIDLNDLNLKDLQTKLSFNNGQVEVQPFDFNIKGIKGRASGSHAFDLDMNYEVALAVPAKFLGSQIGTALSRLSSQEQDSMTVALPISIKGTFKNPNVNLDMQQAVNNLTSKIVTSQKDQLKERGRGILRDVLSGQQQNGDTTTPANPSTRKDTTAVKKDVTKEAVKDVLGGLLGGKKKKKDTLNQ